MTDNNDTTRYNDDRSDTHDSVDHPDHYTWHPTGIECIEVIEEFPHNIAAAMGYCWRHQRKGRPIEDLRKAVWHIQREIQRIETGLLAVQALDAHMARFSTRPVAQRMDERLDELKRACETTGKHAADCDL